MKLYEKIKPTEKCPYCKKNIIIVGGETAFKIFTEGCKICRLKHKYLFKPVTITKVRVNNLDRKPSYNKIYDTDPFNNVSNIKVSGRYH